MTYLIFSQNVCLGITIGMLVRLLAAPEQDNGVAFSLLVASAFGHWMFTRTIRQERARQEEP
jgi:hypothetical protein